MLLSRSPVAVLVKLADRPGLFKVAKDKPNNVYRLVPKEQNPAVRAWPVERIEGTDQWRLKSEKSLISVIDAYNSGMAGKIYPFTQRGTFMQLRTKINIQWLREHAQLVTDVIQAGGDLYRVTRAENIVNGVLTRAGKLIPSGKSTGLLDDYLVDIFEHSAAKSGSEGTALSFTPLKSRLINFYEDNENMVLVRISTAGHRGKIVSVAQLVLDHAERLMALGKISPDTIMKVIHFIQHSKELETFYIDGDIPPEMIRSITRIDRDGNPIPDAPAPG
jgi:hypothetical protein